jgi:putative transposase
MTVTEILAGYYEPDSNGRRRPESLYGSLKMWAHLNRDGIEVARCTVERLMRANGWQGVTRAKKPRTTMSDPTHTRAPDLVDRQFKASEPNELAVADFTYVPMAGGWFAYTAFVVDAYADMIVGWECSTTKETALVESALRQAAAFRARQDTPLGGGTIHHSDAGSQLRFNRSLQHRLVERSLEAHQGLRREFSIRGFCGVGC